MESGVGSDNGESSDTGSSSDIGSSNDTSNISSTGSTRAGINKLRAPFDDAAVSAAGCAPAGCALGVASEPYRAARLLDVPSAVPSALVAGPYASPFLHHVSLTNLLPDTVTNKKGEPKPRRTTTVPKITLCALNNIIHAGKINRVFQRCV
jgi:hypothetical protein